MNHQIGEGPCIGSNCEPWEVSISPKLAVASPFSSDAGRCSSLWADRKCTWPWRLFWWGAQARSTRAACCWRQTCSSWWASARTPSSRPSQSRRSTAHRTASRAACSSCSSSSPEWPVTQRYFSTAGCLGLAAGSIETQGEHRYRASVSRQPLQWAPETGRAARGRGGRRPVDSPLGLSHPSPRSVVVGPGCRSSRVSGSEQAGPGPGQRFHRAGLQVWSPQGRPESARGLGVLQPVPPAGTREKGPPRSEGRHACNKHGHRLPQPQLLRARGQTFVSSSLPPPALSSTRLCVPFPIGHFPPPERYTLPPGDTAWAPGAGSLATQQLGGGVHSGSRGPEVIVGFLPSRPGWAHAPTGTLLCPCLCLPADGLILGAPRADLGNGHLFPHS